MEQETNKSENTAALNLLIREWDGHVTRMYAEILFKISRNNIPPGRRSTGRRKKDGAT